MPFLVALPVPRRSPRAAYLEYRVEEGEAEQHPPELSILHTALKELRVGHRVAAQRGAGGQRGREGNSGAGEDRRGRSRALTGTAAAGTARLQRARCTAHCLACSHWPSPSVCSEQPCPEALWRLVGHLDAALQDGDGEQRAGVAGQPHAEVAVDLQGAHRGGAAGNAELRISSRAPAALEEVNKADAA